VHLQDHLKIMPLKVMKVLGNMKNIDHVDNKELVKLKSLSKTSTMIGEKYKYLSLIFPL